MAQIEGSSNFQDPTLPSHDSQEADPTATHILESMRAVLPDFSRIDMSRWSTYVPEKDTADNGRYIGFYQGEIDPTSPHILYVQKKNGLDHVPIFYNMPTGTGSADHLTLPGNTAYKEKVYGQGKYWDLEESGDIEMSLDVTKLWIEGMHMTPEILDQPAFFIGENNKVVTPRTIIEGARDYKESHSLVGKKNREQAQEDLKAFQPKDIFKLQEEQPELVKQLVLERFNHQAKGVAPFVMGGREYSVLDIIADIENGTELGKKAIELEMYRTAVYINMLWVKNIIRL